MFEVVGEGVMLFLILFFFNALFGLDVCSKAGAQLRWKAFSRTALVRNRHMFVDQQPRRMAIPFFFPSKQN